MGRKAGFISEAGNLGVEGRADSCPKADLSPGPHLADNQWARIFIDGGRGATHRNGTVISDSRLEIGHQWSDQHRLDCFQSN